MDNSKEGEFAVLTSEAPGQRNYGPRRDPAEHQQTSPSVDTKGIPRQNQSRDIFPSDTCQAVSQMLVKKDQSSVQNRNVPSCCAISPRDDASALEKRQSVGAPSFPITPWWLMGLETGLRATC